MGNDIREEGSTAISGGRGGGERRRMGQSGVGGGGV